MIIFCATILLSILIVYLVKKHQFVQQNLPPGPFRLPLLGCTFTFLASTTFLPWKSVAAGRKKYGDIMSFSFGNVYIVFLQSYEIMQDLLNREEWSAKINNDVLKLRSFGEEHGIVFVSNLSLRQEMRKFTQKTLREFGFGRRLSMHGVIEAELTDLIKAMESTFQTTKGVLRIQDHTFSLPILNILWTMVTGVRYSQDDPKVKAFLGLILSTAKMTTLMNPLILFPKLRSLFHKIMPSISLETHADILLRQLHSLVQPLVEERKKAGDYLSEPQNYIDVFLRKIEETANDSNSHYTEKQLIIMLEDLWLVGSMTTSATLNYAILFLVMNQEVQRKVQAEIDSHVPRHLIPSVEDIEKMPYTQATILEIHRLACVIPVPIPRVLEKNVTYKDWELPKGTYVVSNHWAVVMDEKYWGDPETFRPERFINEKGEYVPDKRVIHFGFGKRRCIGITLVDSMVPMFITRLFQKFTMTLVDGEKLPDMKPNVGINITPYPFNVQLNIRD